MSTNIAVNRKRNVTSLSLKQMLRRTNSSLKLRLSCKMDSDYGKSLESDDDTASTSTTSRMSEAESCDSHPTTPVPFNQTSTCNIPSSTHCQSEGIRMSKSHHNHYHSCISSKSNNGGVKRNLHFAKTVRVCLIPSRGEYTYIYSDLWWSVKECESFKKDAYAELKDFIEVNKCSVKDGMFAIYQPVEEEVEEEYLNNNNDMMMEEAAADSILYSALDRWSCDTTPNSNNVHFNAFSSSTHQHTRELMIRTTTTTNNNNHHHSNHNDELMIQQE